MSSELQKKLDEVLLLDWPDEDKSVLTEVLRGVLFFKRVISKTFEKQVIKCIDICISVKKELEEMKRS